MQPRSTPEFNTVYSLQETQGEQPYFWWLAAIPLDPAAPEDGQTPFEALLNSWDEFRTEHS